MVVPVTTRSLCLVVLTLVKVLPTPAFYAGDGTDSITATGRGITVFGGSSADSTSDGADTLSITNLLESTVYGASGADSFVLANTVDSVRIEGGADASEFGGGGV